MSPHHDQKLWPLSGKRTLTAICLTGDHETHAFWTGCKRLIPTRSKRFIEWLKGLSSFSNSEQEQANGLLSHLNGSSKFLNRYAKGLSSIHRRLSLKTSALQNRLTSSPGMKLLLHHIDNNYCLQTHISIWDCSISKNYIGETPRLWWKFLDKMHIA